MANQEKKVAFIRQTLVNAVEQARREVDEAVEALHWFDINHLGKADEQPKVALDDSKARESAKKAEKSSKISPAGSGQDQEAAPKAEVAKPRPTTEQRLIRQLLDELKHKRPKSKKLWTFTWVDLHELAQAKGMNLPPKNFRETINRMGEKGDGFKVSQKGEGRRPTTYFPKWETSEVD
jgi:hypothetical protein